MLRQHGRGYTDTLQDNTAAILEWPGALGILSAAALQPNARIHRFVEIQGTAGTALLRPIEEPVLVFDLVKGGGGGPRKVELPGGGVYRRYEGDFAELAACVAEGKELRAATPEEDLAVHETLLKASHMQ